MSALLDTVKANAHTCFLAHWPSKAKEHMQPYVQKELCRQKTWSSLHIFLEVTPPRQLSQVGQRWSLTWSQLPSPKVRHIWVWNWRWSGPSKGRIRI